jgi:hypothetical protein
MLGRQAIDTVTCLVLVIMLLDMGTWLWTNIVNKKVKQKCEGSEVNICVIFRLFRIWIRPKI